MIEEVAVKSMTVCICIVFGIEISDLKQEPCTKYIPGSGLILNANYGAVHWGRRGHMEA